MKEFAYLQDSDVPIHLWMPWETPLSYTRLEAHLDDRQDKNENLMLLFRRLTGVGDLWDVKEL